MGKRIIKGIKKKVKASDQNIVRLSTKIAIAIKNERVRVIPDLFARLGSNLNFDGKELTKSLKSIKKLLLLEDKSPFVRNYIFAIDNEIAEIKEMGW